MTIEDKAAASPELGARVAGFAVSAARTLLGFVLIALVLLNVANAVARAAGLTGQITFDEKGDIKGGAISMFKVVNGKLEYVSTVR